MEDVLLAFVKAELLGDPEAALAIDDDFLASGTVDHLGVMLLAEFIEKQYRITVPTEDVVPENFGSVSLLAAYVERRTKAASPLTNAQQMLWTSEELHPGEPMYNTAFLFTFDGVIDPDVMRAAFGRLVGDADVLRTVIASEDGVPRQAVLNTIDFEMPVVDLSGADDPDAAAHEWASSACRTPLDIGTITFDTALLKLGEDRFAWYFNQHHIVSDAWALGVLYDRLAAWYSATLATGSTGSVSLDPLPAFANYVDHEQNVRSTGMSASVATATSAVPPSMYGLAVRGDSPRNHRVAMDAPDDLAEALSQLAQDPQVRALTSDLSMFQVLATATIAFVHRTSGQNVVTIGVPVHNRSTAEFRRMPGLFMEVYPLEVAVEESDTFATLHARVAAAMTQLIRSARPGSATAASNRGINVLLNYLTVSFDPFGGIPVHADWIHTGSVDSHHVLRIQAHDFVGSGGMSFGFDANESVFDESVRARIPGHFIRLLRAMTEEWDQPVAGADLLDPSERAAVIASTNSGNRSGETTPDVVERFLAWAASDPDAVAVSHRDESYSYAELQQLTGAVASGIAPGSRVGIAMHRSVEAVVSILGVLRAGATFVPIDPAWPTERVEFVIEDADIDLVLAMDPIAAKVPVREPAELAQHHDGSQSTIAADDLAYILYTSGSTGTPKGVMIEHGSLANYASWASHFYDQGQRLTFPLFTALTFDLTITSLFVPLISGGAIRVYDEAAGQADLSVVDVVEEDAVDIVKLTPSHLALVAETQARPTRIQQLILGGEDLTTAAATAALTQFGATVLVHNEYGPTEATVGCVIHTYDHDTDTGASVPIGRPIDGARAYVVDAVGNPVPIGVPGELWIGGRGVARGYQGLDRLTAEQFAPAETLPEDRVYRTGDLARVRDDGIIEYLGRRDDQVKIKGVRAELGEIEAALSSYPGVSASAARLWETNDAGGSTDLVFCSRCGLASDYPGVSFDAARVCSECIAFDDYGSKARVYFKHEDELLALLSSQTGSRGRYDCISLLSGGKDSTYVLCRLVDMGLNVLALTLDNGYLSQQAIGNISRVVEALGVDHRFVSTPAMNEIFVDSLQRHANVCNGCFKTIYTLGMQTALDEDIPYIVTGLSRGQFFETRLTADLFTEMTVSSDAIDANVLEARKAYHQVDDAVNRLLDVSMFEDDAVFDLVEFVDFYRYVDVSLGELYGYLDERVPWVKPTDTGRSTNCLINDVGIYYHRKMRGYHNYALPYSWDVRMGHKTRDAALEELDDAIDVTEVARMLDEIGFPEDVTSPDSGTSLVSYYVAPVDIPTPELKAHMAATLPRQLIPNRFVRLDTLPLTTNGKVDRDQLPAADSHRPDMATAYVAARSEKEVLLTQIWEQVLGVDGIGIRDNYFDLGGDSITAVQIIARAHRIGLPITMHQLAEELTIEKLAAASSMSSLQRAERLTGPVELTPIQHWFFDEVDEPSHFHHIVRIKSDGEVAGAAVRSALATLADHHDALRQSFSRSGDSWVSSISDEAPEVPVEIVASGESHDTNRLAAPFDLARAPLMRASVQTTADGSTEVLIAAHHLIVDGVSWSHLIDDLGHLTSTGPEDATTLPAVMTSLQTWMDVLAAASDEIDQAPWRTIVEADVVGWRESIAGSDGTGSLHIDPGETSALLAKASDLGMGIDEILVALISTALSERMGTESVRVFVEGHGRESDSPLVDVTRTMGWFTSLFPVLMEQVNAADGVASLHAIRDQIRTASSRGRDYGVLRYLHSEAAVRQAMSLNHQDHLVVNYLGRLTNPNTSEDGTFSLAGPISLDRPKRRNEIFGAEITAFIVDGALTVEWTAKSGAPTLDAIIRSALEAMSELAAAKDGASTGFALADLDDDSAEKLAALLDAVDRGGSS